MAQHDWMSSCSGECKWCPVSTAWNRSLQLTATWRESGHETMDDYALLQRPPRRRSYVRVCLEGCGMSLADHSGRRYTDSDWLTHVATTSAQQLQTRYDRVGERQLCKQFWQPIVSQLIIHRYRHPAPHFTTSSSSNRAGRGCEVIKISQENHKRFNYRIPNTCGLVQVKYGP